MPLSTIEDATNIETEKDKYYGKINDKSVKTILDNYNLHDVDEEDQVTWKMVSSALDRISFVVCLMWLFAICLAFVLVVSNS